MAELLNPGTARGAFHLAEQALCTDDGLPRAARLAHQGHCSATRRACLRSRSALFTRGSADQIRHPMERPDGPV
jgi:hypothetical protein